MKLNMPNQRQIIEKEKKYKTKICILMYSWTEQMKTQVCLRDENYYIKLENYLPDVLTPHRTTMTSCMER